MSASIEKQDREQPVSLWQEPFRPQFHFSPRKNWINDPNGLVYFEGEYHLFFQYNPFGKKWGHMSWGHAVSADLLHWQELPVAIPETDHMIFSGSALVDWENVSGFGIDGKPPLLAFYTTFDEAANRQSQHLAYSRDRGRSWTPYEGNPVLDLDKEHFRDPQVFWYAPGNHWVLVVALPQEHKIQIYNSHDLLDWSLKSEFGPAGNAAGQWECPNLCEVPVDGVAASRWVLKVDVDKNFLNGGSGSQYFVGEFDGMQFMPEADSNGSLALTTDFGADFYAAITWSDLPEQHDFPVWIGWMSNHQSGVHTPTDPWRGSMTVPRELFLFMEDGAHRLGQRPVAQFEALRRSRRDISDITLSPGIRFDLGDLGPTGAVDLSFRHHVSGNGIAGVRMIGDDGNHIDIGYDALRGDVYIDRRQAGGDFHPDFPAKHTCPVAAETFRILIDAASVELFVNGGRYVLTDAHFLKGEKKLVLFAEGEEASFSGLSLYELASIHKT